jgi:AcrR family transcriptional regulator
MSATDTRGKVLDAALECFAEDGYEHTPVARIRERSGISNGALFHHFPTKDAIGDALYVEAMASYHEGLWELIARRPRSLRAAVRGTIAHQLGWVEQHADLARFVYTRGHLDLDSPGNAHLTALNRELAAALEQWMAPLVERGEIRAMPMLMIVAIVNGPAHAIARRWLAGQLGAMPTAFADELADAAVAGLRGTPVRGRGARRQAAQQGRVTFELVAGDGSVVAHGHATADLT